ncbi:MAG TPA: N-acetylneuraminate synthase family protein [Phycisphaerae bacterium]|nr:N-acetylneuraminate synthase family protein [Phycisphaerae bacterium]
MDRAISIGPKLVSRDGPPLVMAEIGVNHDGSLSKGEQLVDAAAQATCDAVKFQLFRAELLLAKSAGLVDYQKSAATSAEDLLSNLEMGPEEMGRLIARAKSRGIAAIVTPFSPELVQPCVTMGVDAIKLASPDLVNKPLLEAAAATGLPLIVSTGAAELTEVERTVGWLYKLGAAERTVLLHCVSSYPTEAEHATLGAITVLRQRFAEMPIGYSDHTAETFTAALAVACGSCFLEKHLTLDKKAKGPDHTASLETAEMAEYAALARIGFAMRGPFAKRPLGVEQAVREQTRQSVVARTDLNAGTLLTREMLTVKRPGTGIPAADLDRVIDRILTRNVAANATLAWADVGGET